MVREVIYGQLPYRHRRNVDHAPAAVSIQVGGIELRSFLKSRSPADADDQAALLESAVDSITYSVENVPLVPRPSGTATVAEN
jgi:hypothetical protein